MKICFVGIVFNGEHFLEPVIRQVHPFGKVVFVEGPTAHYQDLGFTTSTDRTNEILADLIGEANVLHGQWDEKDSMSAATVKLIPDDTDFVWWLDADESYLRQDLYAIIDLLATDAFDSVAFTANSFFGGFERILGGFEEAFEVHRIQRWYPGAQWATHRPPTVNAPDGHPWREHRHLTYHDTDARGIRMFHYSYVFPSQVGPKAAYYAGYNSAVCIPNYFADVFMPWVRGGAAERQAIEDKWRGPHNFVPMYRGDCFSRHFEGEHPEAINAEMPFLERRLADELKGN